MPCSLCGRWQSREFAALKGFLRQQLTPNRVDHACSVQVLLFRRHVVSSIRTISILESSQISTSFVVGEGDTRCRQTTRREGCIQMHGTHFGVPSCSILGVLGTSSTLRFVVPRTLHCTVEADIGAIHPRIQNHFSRHETAFSPSRPNST